MHIKQCRFILNTLNQTLQKNNIKVQPKIKSELLINLIAADANPYTAEITLNKVLNNRLLRPVTRKLIKHEVKHIEQFQIMARYFAGISENSNKGLGSFREFLLQKYPFFEYFNFNEKFYSQTIKKDGIINQSHPLFEKAKNYVNALKEYPDLSVLDDLEIWCEKGFKQMIKNRRNKKKLYKNNLLEVEARQASKQK